MSGILGTRTSISVVVPNARAFPADLVHELAAQLQEDDEIIVVRNSPTGGRRRWTGLLSPAAPVEPRPPLEGKRVLTIGSPSGAAAARNVGWRTARHTWILFLDDDVDVPPCFLDTVRSRVSEEHAPGVMTFRVQSQEGPWLSLITRTISLDRGSGERHSTGTPLALSETWRFGAGAAILARRDILESTGGFKEPLGAGRKHGGGEDLEFLWHASRHTTIRYLGRLSVQHRDVERLGDVGRQLRHYGRAIALLAGQSRQLDGLHTAIGYCRHLASAVLGRGKLAELSVRERCILRLQALAAMADVGRVYASSVIVDRRSRVLCEDCLAK